MNGTLLDLDGLQPLRDADDLHELDLELALRDLLPEFPAGADRP